MKRKELWEAWIKALESGEYKQGNGALANKIGGEFEFCCLGVVCMVDGRSATRLNGLSFLPKKLSKKLGVEYRGSFIKPVQRYNRVYMNLAQMNDNGVPFKTIAKIIRKQLAAGNFQKQGDQNEKK